MTEEKSARIKARITAKYDSMTKFALLLGVAKSNVSQVLSGKVKWPAKKVKRAAMYLGYSDEEAAELFGASLIELQAITDEDLDTWTGAEDKELRQAIIENSKDFGDKASQTQEQPKAERQPQQPTEAKPERGAITRQAIKEGQTSVTTTLRMSTQTLANLKAYAEATGKPIGTIVNDSFNDWFTAHPLDDEEQTIFNAELLKYRKQGKL